MRGALCVATHLYILYLAADESISGWEFFLLIPKSPQYIATRKAELGRFLEKKWIFVRLSRFPLKFFKLKIFFFFFFFLCVCSLACLNVAFSVEVTTFLFFSFFFFFFFLVASICWKSLFLCISWYVFFFYFFYLKKQYVTLGKKNYEPRRWLTEVAVYFRGVVWVFLGGFSGISSSRVGVLVR